MSGIVITGLWAVTAVACWVFQWWLRSENVVQKIYELSPKTHQKKKVTPTMGGAIFIPILCAGAMMTGPITPALLWLIGLAIMFAGIGLWDDIAAIVNKKNAGLTARKKFSLQNGLGLLFLWVVHTQLFPLAVWEWPVYLFVLTGTSNATNLTDGLDGLLAGLAIITFWGFYNLTNVAEVQTLSLIAVAVLAGFLMINYHPAKLFMGDTGSLALSAYPYPSWACPPLCGLGAWDFLSMAIKNYNI